MKKPLVNCLLPVALVLFLLIHSFITNAACLDNSLPDSIHSKILNQKRQLVIHLPRNYDSSKKYAVVYVLDGTSQDQHIADKFDSLYLANNIPQAIIVGIPNMSRENRLFQLVPPYMHTDPEKPDSPMGTADTFLQFMESELIPFMEKKYNTSNVRLFAGNSRGGLLVMYSLLYKPYLFSARFCFSTPVWRENNLLVSKVADFLTSKESIRSFLYMSVGADETANMKSGYAAMMNTLKEKAGRDFTWYVDYTPNAIHQNNSQLSASSGILKWSEYMKSSGQR